jgi:hypothetical protein
MTTSLALLAQGTEFTYDKLVMEESKGNLVESGKIPQNHKWIKGNTSWMGHWGIHPFLGGKYQDKIKFWIPENAEVKAY